MLNDLIPLKNLIEDMQWSPAINHVILGDDLEPTHNRFLGENVLIVGHAKADPNSKVRESIERICWHVSSFRKRKRGSGLSARPFGGRGALVLFGLIVWLGLIVWFGLIVWHF